MHHFSDCLALLDGRLKKLTTFIVQMEYIDHWTSTSHNGVSLEFYDYQHLVSFQDDLPDLKRFSLISYNSSQVYANKVLPVLRRMSHLEQLTLYLHFLDEPRSICDSRLDNDILIYMPRLHTFALSICQ